jgi:hypothetical protein
LDYAEFDITADQEGIVFSVLGAHNPDVPSSDDVRASEVASIAAGADTEARSVPDFMGWTPAQAEQWVTNNVTDLPTAKLALRKMAMNIAALNARVFPHIRAEKN